MCFHFECSIFESTTPVLPQPVQRQEEKIAHFTRLTLFLFYKCSLCFNCPKTSTPRCPVLIRFLFSLQLLHRFSSPTPQSLTNLPEQRHVPLSLHKSGLLGNKAVVFVLSRYHTGWGKETPQVVLKGDTSDITPNMSS